VPQVSLVLRDLGVATSAVSGFTSLPLTSFSAYARWRFRFAQVSQPQRDLGHPQINGGGQECPPHTSVFPARPDASGAKAQGLVDSYDTAEAVP